MVDCVKNKDPWLSLFHLNGKDLTSILRHDMTQDPKPIT